jgi:hypothetical protein
MAAAISRVSAFFKDHFDFAAYSAEEVADVSPFVLI